MELRNLLSLSATIVSGILWILVTYLWMSYADLSALQCTFVAIATTNFDLLSVIAKMVSKFDALGKP